MGKVEVAVVAGVGKILLNRPKKLNCLSLGMIKRFKEVLAAWDKPDSGVKVDFLVMAPIG